MFAQASETRGSSARDARRSRSVGTRGRAGRDFDSTKCHFVSYFALRSTHETISKNKTIQMFLEPVSDTRVVFHKN